MKIGIDFDDVIVDTVGAWCALANKHHGGDRWEPKSFTEWDLSKQTGISPNTVHQMFLDVVYTECNTVPAALLGIEELVVDHDVVVLTDNPRYDEMRHWLDLHGLREVPLEAELSDKAMYASMNDFDVIVDDKPDTLRRASVFGVHAIRFLRPWNANMEGWGANECEYSAHTWGEMLARIRWIEFFYKQPTLANYGVRNALSDAYDLIDPTPFLVPEGKVDCNDFFGEPICPEPVIASIEEDGYAFIAGVDYAPVVTNAKGAKQTDLKARFDLLPALALKKVAGVLEQGAKKYGQGNWRGLSVEECHNHTLGHAIAFNRTNNIEDLAHAACRALMTLELALVEELENGPKN